MTTTRGERIVCGAHRIQALLASRPLRRLRPPAADRGDSPVPSAIIIAGLAIIAIGVLAWLVTYVSGFMEAAPTDLPEGP
jgi:hypothetical protein